MLARILFFITAIFMIYISTDIKSEEKEEDKTINVEIRGEVENPGVYELKRGSDMNDIFAIADLNDNADISQYSYQDRLYNKQLIIIPEKKEEKLISINSASIIELITLPGIGEKTAEKIIEYRDEFGGFKSLEDIKNVKGIGEAKYNRIKDYICL